MPGFLIGFLGPVLQDDLGITKPAVGVLVAAFFGATVRAPVTGMLEALGAAIATSYLGLVLGDLMRVVRR